MGVVKTIAMFSSADDVVELTPDNFDKLVLKSDGVWVIEFYAPWYGNQQVNCKLN